MTDDEIDKFRAAERVRMAPMREAARKESFVQGWLRGKFGVVAAQSVAVLGAQLAALSEADEAYREHASKRGPA